jgi:hypothetical protein
LLVLFYTQILAFHESSFDMGKFMALMMSEDAADSANTSPAEQREHAARSVDTLRTSSCQLLLLASAVEVFGAAPAHSLLPCAAVDDGSGSKLAVGPLSLACLRRLTACRTSLETLLPGATATAERCLTILDPAMLECIRSAEQSLYCAKAFTQSVPAETGDAEELLPALVARAEMAVDLLDQDCPISAPRLQDALVGALPILLLACCESESDFSAEAQTLLAMIVRVLSCGRDTSKSLLLQHLMSWMACTGRVALSEPLLGLVRLFELQPRHGRHLVLLLSTPAVVQALVTDTYLAQENADGALSLAAVDLLELICGELNRREIDRSALEDWAAVLLPLKTLEWDPAQANKSQSARFQFTRRLQVRFSPPSCFLSCDFPPHPCVLLNRIAAANSALPDAATRSASPSCWACSTRIARCASTACCASAETSWALRSRWAWTAPEREALKTRTRRWGS